MDLDTLISHYFGSSDLDALDETAIETGLEKVAIAFGTERDAGRCFALWTLLHVFGMAPDPATAFKDPAERKAAEDYDWAARKIDRKG